MSLCGKGDNSSTKRNLGLLSESFDLIKVRETGILPNKLKLAITLSPVCFDGDGVTW